MDSRGNQEELIARYEAPVNMGGYIKMASLFEKSGDYLMAEKTYLQQVQRNREAGYLRGKQTQPSPFQIISGVNYNFYWATINRQAEAATFNFYQRMLRRFPRDSEWQEKAGMFLYQRLLLAFRKVPVSKYVTAYEGIKKYAYPFLFSDVTGNLPEHQEIQFDLPGTGDTIIIATPKYDPLDEALGSLRLAVKLSGDAQPNPLLLEAIADLSSWTGNQKTALDTYKEIIQNQHADATLQTKIIDYSFAINESVFAMNQLEALHKLRKTTQTQDMQLANGYAMSGATAKALEVLSKISSVNGAEKAALAMVYAKSNWLVGKNNTALRHLNAIAAADAGPTNPDSVNALRFYTVARLHALLKQNEKALYALKRSLQSGFSYGYVLETDPAWNVLRTSVQWKALTRKYSPRLFETSYQVMKEEVTLPSMAYMIPD
jgi:tetratricopeptide (TPR) repeat protein